MGKERRKDRTYARSNNKSAHLFIASVEQKKHIMMRPPTTQLQTRPLSVSRHVYFTEGWAVQLKLQHIVSNVDPTDTTLPCSTKSRHCP